MESRTVMLVYAVSPELVMVTVNGTRPPGTAVLFGDDLTMVRCGTRTVAAAAQLVSVLPDGQVDPNASVVARLATDLSPAAGWRMRNGMRTVTTAPIDTSPAHTKVPEPWLTVPESVLALPV